ncbi:hypothetical protein BKA62DRAFT_580867, partial [Auriculariales sp. MPI-PUGE-AT-0066]
SSDDYDSGDTEYSDFSIKPGSVHSSDSEGTKRRKRTKRRRWDAKQKAKKIERRALGDMKVKPYSGVRVFRVYEEFCRSFIEYCKLNYIARKRCVYFMRKFLEGDALEFYETAIYPYRDIETVEEALKKIFRACFPLDFIAQMRLRFERFEQRDLSVQKFKAKLDEFARCIGNLTEVQMASRFWFGARIEIRRQLQLDRFSPERDTLDTLAEHAEVVELTLSAERNVLRQDLDYKIREKSESRRRGHSPSRKSKDLRREDRREKRDEHRSERPSPHVRNSGRENSHRTIGAMRFDTSDAAVDELITAVDSMRFGSVRFEEPAESHSDRTLEAARLRARIYDSWLLSSLVGGIPYSFDPVSTLRYERFTLEVSEQRDHWTVRDTLTKQSFDTGTTFDSSESVVEWLESCKLQECRWREGAERMATMEFEERLVWIFARVDAWRSHVFAEALEYEQNRGSAGHAQAVRMGHIPDRFEARVKVRLREKNAAPYRRIKYLSQQRQKAHWRCSEAEARELDENRWRAGDFDRIADMQCLYLRAGVSVPSSLLRPPVEVTDIPDWLRGGWKGP